MPMPLQGAYEQLRGAYGLDRSLKAKALPSEQLVVKLLELIITDGAQRRASDIHLEPSSHELLVRFRVDGLLHEMLALPSDLGDLLVRAIKVRAEMATEMVGRSKPQDGRIDFHNSEETLDLRVSSFPTLHGDVLAIRILDHAVDRLRLEQLGLPVALLKSFEHLLRQPNGMVLVTGPANSGKTTTLYAALEELASPHVKIMTLEDPVEYQMERVNQAQISASTGLTFAQGLRAILRQDANIILVGEIRDKDTAEIATRAALTGHVVFSTLHTRHSCGAVVRLMDMGIEPHLIVASTNGILAQRLVRNVCGSCAARDEVAHKTFVRMWTEETGEAPPPADPGRFARGAGCAGCSGTGYHGRTGIFELLILTEHVKRLILDEATTSLYREAVASGMRSMMLDGLLKASQGLTTIEEVIRVTGEAEEL